jgi:4-hydroxythreonine-4-phosphate dehydrogenase
MTRRARLAVTLGDPRGIGAEVVRKALLDARVTGACDVVVVGPRGLEVEAGVATGEWQPGGTAAQAGRAAGLAIERAVAMASAGEVEGIVTAPIDKHALLAGGFDFPGHTEMLAALTGAKTAMMLASDRLRVVLATTHIALRDVAEAVTTDAIVQAARTTRAGLRSWFGIAEPRLALCALNPHAGDSGRFGDEEARVLVPAARAEGLLGPFPADTVFVRAMRGEFDAVITPYHDLGMTAIKVASFGHAVNVTLGLPFPRTSPDHGTAVDIAGNDRADAGSMIEAMLMCASIAERLRKVGRRS